MLLAASIRKKRLVVVVLVLHMHVTLIRTYRKLWPQLRGEALKAGALSLFLTNRGQAPQRVGNDGEAPVARAYGLLQSKLQGFRPSRDPH